MPNGRDALKLRPVLDDQGVPLGTEDCCAVLGDLRASADLPATIVL